jgi:hypothetical protein
MSPIHTRLLSVLSQLKTSGDRFKAGLAGWLEMADSVEIEPPNLVITAGMRETSYRITAIEAVLAEYGV